MVCYPVSSRDIQDSYVAPLSIIAPRVFEFVSQVSFFSAINVILIAAVSENTNFLFALSSEHEVKPAAILNRLGVLELLKYLKATIHITLRSLLSSLYCLELNSSIKACVTKDS